MDDAVFLWYAVAAVFVGRTLFLGFALGFWLLNLWPWRLWTDRNAFHFSLYNTYNRVNWCVFTSNSFAVSFDAKDASLWLFHHEADKVKEEKKKYLILASG